MPCPGEEGGEEGGEATATWSARARQFPPEVLAALETYLGTSCVPTSGLSSSYITVHGLSYSVNSQHRGNSQAMFKIPGRQDATPGIIHRIFQVNFEEQVRTYLFIERMDPAEVRRNPFAEHLWLRMGLFVSNSTFLIVEPHSVLSHFAQLPVTWESQQLSCIVSLGRT